MSKPYTLRTGSSDALVVEALTNFIGQPCPRNTDLAAATGLTERNIEYHLVELRRQGVLVVERIATSIRRICVNGKWTLPSKHNGSTAVPPVPCSTIRGSRLLLDAVERLGKHPAPPPIRKHPQQIAIAAAYPARWSRA